MIEITLILLIIFSVLHLLNSGDKKRQIGLMNW